MDKSTTSGYVDGDGETGNHTNSSQNPETLKHQTWPSQSMAKNTGERKNYKRAANRGKKGSRILSDRNYSLGSSYNTVRVLRSTSAAKQSRSDVVVQPAANKSPDYVHIPVQPAAKRVKRGRPSMKAPNNEFSKILQGGRPAMKAPNNEFSKIRQRVRYILNRMNYEQSLLEAYASEGWKRQSLEKIRPEKELERAKAEILRCKLRIREAFQNLDCLLSAGKLEESLFDSEGEISSEDIFCATCGLQNVTLNNDIILCDGVCDRGFHQQCLNPPLLTKDIPAGDEGWLCPACDCKIDCIDVINELQGTDLSFSDSWEKVFPEAATLAHGSKQNDASDLPSDDSEDDDFDPNIAEEHVAGHEEGSSEEDGDNRSDSGDSNFITSSDNSEHLKDKKKVDDLGLPSEDSEDDDYDPAGPDSDKDIEEKQDDSDFTSDSDDFCAEITKSCGQDEVSSGAKSGGPTNHFGGATFQIHTAIPNLTSKDLQMDQDVVLPVSGRRQVQRLDYKKLYDDAYGEAPSDSSDGGEWSGKSTPKKDIDDGQRTNVPPESIQNYATTSVGCPKGEFRENHGKHTSSRYVGRPKDGSAEDHILGLELEDEGSDSDDPNFITSSDNSEPLMKKEKVDDLGLPSEDSEDDDYDPAGPDSDKDTEKKKSSSDDSDFSSDSDDNSEPLMEKEKVDDLGLPSEDSEDDDYDPAGPDSDKDTEKKKSSSDDSDFSSDSDDFCAEIAKSCGQDGVPSSSKAGGDSINDLEGTILRGNTAISDLPSKDLEIDQDIVLTAPSGAKAGGDPINGSEGTKPQANTTISNLPSKDLEMDQDVVLPVSGRRQEEAYGETSSDSSDAEDYSGKSTTEKDNGKQSEAGSFALKSSRRTGTVHQSNESTPPTARQSLHRDAFHGSVNVQNTGEVLTPNGSNSTTQRKQFGPIINQRLHKHFKTDQYPSRAVKESLAQELGLTFRQVSKWFETTRRNTRVAASKNGSHLENHNTDGIKSPVVAHVGVKDAKEGMVEKLIACKNVNEGIKQDNPQKQDLRDGLGTHVTPPDQRYTTTSRLVGCPKGESRENHGKNTPSKYAVRPKDGYAEDVVLALEVIDEGTKKAALQNLKKRKMGR